MKVRISLRQKGCQTFLKNLTILFLSAVLICSCKEDVNTSDLNFKDKQLIEAVLERIQSEYVDDIKRQELIEGILNGIFSALDDYSIYLNEKQYKAFSKMTMGTYAGFGMEIVFDKPGIKVIAPMDDSPALKAGIKAGDVITHINDVEIADLSPMEAYQKLQGNVGNTVKFHIVRKGVKSFDVKIKRQFIKTNPVKHSIVGGVGVVRLSYFSVGVDKLLKTAINKIRKQLGSKLKGIVLDLRNNPGGTLEQSIAVCNLFISKGMIVSTKGRNTERNQVFNASGSDIIKGLPLVLLVNKGSASASEVVAGCLQHHKRAVIMGQKTFGKGSVQEMLRVPGYGGLKLTIARFYTPANQQIHNQGISPDIEVVAIKEKHTDKKDKQSKRDVQLQRALDLVNGISVVRRKQSNATANK